MVAYHTPIHCMAMHHTRLGYWIQVDCMSAWPETVRHQVLYAIGLVWEAMSGQDIAVHTYHWLYFPYCRSVTFSPCRDIMRIRTMSFCFVQHTLLAVSDPKCDYV